MGESPSRETLFALREAIADRGSLIMRATWQQRGAENFGSRTGHGPQDLFDALMGQCWPPGNCSK